MVLKASLTSSLRTDQCTFCNGFKSVILTRLLLLIISRAQGWPAVAHCVTPASCLPVLLLIVVWCAMITEWQGHWRMGCREQETPRASIRHFRGCRLCSKTKSEGNPLACGKEYSEIPTHCRSWRSAVRRGQAGRVSRQQAL